ncbi:MAG: lysophospholipid acyltransferase family protein [Candidatus Firestonebacteria bacterium]|nr:lysophospholipid acyltransferase family protein [Candidatus Firestonebacteria bacterium]
MSNKIKDKILLWIVSNFGWLVVYILCFTVRLEVKGEEILEYYYKQGKRVIFTFWHDTQLFFVYYYRNRNIHVLISESKDGEYIKRVIEKLGFKSVRGSSTRNGIRALLNMIDFVSNGNDAGFTPDGPRGPRHVLKEGVLLLSQKTETPIIPICFSSSNKKYFNSWDKFQMPMPFSRGILIYGKPFVIPMDCNKEDVLKYKTEVENELNRLWLEADNYFKI